MELAALATDLLLAVQEAELCGAIPKGSRCGQQWAKFYDSIFMERAIFGGYKKWNGNSPWMVKLKPMCTGLIEHFSNAYDKRNEEDSTPLEVVARTLKDRMDAADRGKVEDKDLAFARRVQNELAESST